MNCSFDDIVARLSAENISSPRLEARMMLAYILDTDASTIVPSQVNLTDTQADKLQEMIEERLEHKPLCKILGTKSFYKYDFVVNEDVLSPRPDTEILVETAVEFSKQFSFNKILDMGTGSGCILLSLLGEIPDAVGTGIDISPAALSVARTNAKRLGYTDRCRFFNSSWFEDKFDYGSNFDLIVSNPPYIPTKDIAGLDEEVKFYDPLTALDGGADGLKDYRRIAEISSQLLNDDGFLLLEFGINQSAEVKKIFLSAGLELVDIKKDLSGKDRCIILKK